MSLIQFVTLIVMVAAQTPSRPNPAVVFVCEHGAAKSVIATAYFNKLAAERGLPFRATFRGTSSAGRSVRPRRRGFESRRRGRTGRQAVGDQRYGRRGCDAHLRHRLHASRGGRSIGQGRRLVRRAGRQGYGPMRDAIVRHVKRCWMNCSDERTFWAPKGKPLG